MKNIIVLFFALAIGVTAQAQEQSRYRTGASVRSQYVNNNLPGARYSDPSVKTSKAGAVPQKSYGAQLKENTLPGVPYKTSNTGGASAAAQQSSASATGVASDKKAEQPAPVKMPETPKNLTQ